MKIKKLNTFKESIEWMKKVAKLNKQSTLEPKSPGRVRELLGELHDALTEEYGTKEAPVLFLDDKTYYGLVRELRGCELFRNGNFNSDNMPTYKVDMITNSGLFRILNKSELYSLTSVINRICNE